MNYQNNSNFKSERIEFRTCSTQEAYLLLTLALPEVTKRVDDIDKAMYFSPELWKKRMDL